MDLQQVTHSPAWMRAGWTMVHYLWVGGALGGMALAARLILARADARVRYAAALLSLTCLAAAPPLIALHLGARDQTRSFATSLDAPHVNIPAAATPRLARSTEDPTLGEESHDADASDSRAQNLRSSEIPPDPHRLIPLLPWAWLAGGSLMLAWSLVGLVGTERLRRRASSAAGEVLTQSCRRLAECLHVTRDVTVRLCDRAISPILIGIVRPMILLPAALVSELTPAQLEMILLHELAHVRRWDNLVNVAQRMVESVLFFQPAVWLVSRWVRREREHCCDDVVLRLRDDRDGYAEALLAVAGAMPAMLAAGSPAAEPSHLAVRLRRILGAGETLCIDSRAAATALLCAAAATLLFTASVRSADAEQSKPVLQVAKEAGARFSGVQAAIDAAPDGATIRIGPGVYDESILIKKPLTLEGAGANKTTIRIPNGKMADVNQAAIDAEKNIREGNSRPELAAALAKLQQKMAVPAMVIEGARGVSVRGLKLTAEVTVLPDPGRGIGGSNLLRVSNSKAKIEDCSIAGSPGDGIHVTDGSDFEIARSLVAAAWGTGIATGSRSGEKVSARISDCDVRNCYYAGITIGYRDDVTIERCRISGAAWHGIRYAGSPKVLNNIIWGNARCGIYADANTPGAVVEGNLFLRNEWTGIACWNVNVDRIVGNTFAYNGREAFAGLGGAKPTLERNIFFANELAIDLGTIGNSGRGPRDPHADEPGDPKMKDNVFWQNKALLTRPSNDPKSPVKLTKASELGDARAGVDADPKLVNPEKNDLSVSADSPARKMNAGAMNVPVFASPWEITAEEKTIIPDGPGRQSNEWKKGK